MCGVEVVSDADAAEVPLKGGLRAIGTELVACEEQTEFEVAVEDVTVYRESNLAGRVLAAVAIGPERVAPVHFDVEQLVACVEPSRASVK